MHEWIENMWWIYMKELYHKKEWNPAICDNMDGHWTSYAKWNKQTRQIPQNFTRVWDLKKAKWMNTQNKSKTNSQM